MNDKVGKVTLAELEALRQKLSKTRGKDVLVAIREFRDSHAMNDQEALAVARMAPLFKYDAPRKQFFHVDDFHQEDK